MIKKALITGITGQDGSFLALARQEHTLAEAGHRVVARGSAHG